MKSLRVSRISSVILTLVIALGIFLSVGCGVKSAVTVQPTQVAQPEQPVATTQSKPDKVVIWGIGDNANIADWNKDRIIMAMEKATNTDIEVVTIPWDSFVDRLNASLATGYVPDIIGILNQREARGLIEQMAKDGVIAAFEGPVADAAPYVLSRYDVDPSLTEIKINGKIYMNPIVWGTKLVPDFGAIYVRQEVLDKLNMKPPDTFDEYFTYLKDCMKETGAQGLVLNNAIDQSLSAFLGAYGLPWTGWVKRSDGSYGYWAVEPGVKDALLLFRSMVAQGLVDPVSWENQGEITERFGAGSNCSIIQNGGGNISFLQKTANTAGKGVKSYLLPAPRANSDMRGYTSQPMWESVSLIGNLKENNPVAAARVLNFVDSPEGGKLIQLGVEGIDWKMTDGKIELLEARTTEGGFPTDLSSVPHAISFKTGYWATPELLEWQMTYGEDDAYVAWNKQMLDNQQKYTISAYGFNVSSPLWTKFQPTGTDLVNRTFIEIVKSESEADAIAKFDQFVKDWMAQGGEAATVEMNKLLSEVYK